MALQDFIDWKGRSVNPKRHGGVKATMFIYFLIVMTNMGNIPTMLNIVSFLHGTMHMGVADASTTATNFYGALCVFSFLGAFISDSYIKRFYTILIFAPVEEAKIILRMLPVFFSSVLGYVPIPLLLTFTVQQGGTMDTRLGATNVPPASLFIMPIIFQILILVIYDRAIVPWLSRATGYAGGITHLQRVGVRFASNIVALGVAAVVESHRRDRASSSAAPTMSVFWLTTQFFLLGVTDVTSFVGLLEFFSSEASAGMKSIGGAVFFCILGVASWLGSFLIQVVDRATTRHSGGHGWLDGSSLNAGRLDLFYWLLALFGLVSFVLYLFCACRYTYSHDPRVQSTMEEDRVSPAPMNHKEAPV
ncbi:hypothetical protein PR202_ga03666 [Eleusine coracana subsp. coracana]|uniref:Uncharacterized protein n=1 Tax=Eleusine coracana subsp. coracana TaxID=191504 RepID=A0AAV5BMY9_ELECO|nr:hypothetical protein PR202_ga03666 [Eleusine coracana subsp. coracana]